MKKIYIIGGVATGKTTFSRKLSQKLNIKCYELDNVVWNDEHSVKRNDEERELIFNTIISNDEWIIEDVGRRKFKKGLIEADTIYFIYINSIKIYYRVLKRWIKQKLNIEPYNYKPTLKGLIEMYKWAIKDIKKRDDKIKELEGYKDKLHIVNSKDIKKILKENL